MADSIVSIRDAFRACDLQRSTGADWGPEGPLTLRLYAACAEAVPDELRALSPRDRAACVQTIQFASFSAAWWYLWRTGSEPADRALRALGAEFWLGTPVRVAHYVEHPPRVLAKRVLVEPCGDVGEPCRARRRLNFDMA